MPSRKTGVGSRIIDTSIDPPQENEYDPPSLWTPYYDSDVIEPGGYLRWRYSSDGPVGAFGSQLGAGPMDLGLHGMAGTGSGSGALGWPGSGGFTPTPGGGGGTIGPGTTERSRKNSELMQKYQLHIDEYERYLEYGEGLVNPFDWEDLVEAVLELRKALGYIVRGAGTRMKKLAEAYDELEKMWDEIVKGSKLLKFAKKLVPIVKWGLTIYEIIEEGDMSLDTFLELLPFLIGDVIKWVIAQNVQTQDEYDALMKQGMIDALKKKFKELGRAWNPTWDDLIKLSKL